MDGFFFVCVPLVNIPTHTRARICRKRSKCVSKMRVIPPSYFAYFVWALSHLEDNLLVRDNVQHILGHAVVNQSRHGPELSLSQGFAALGLDQVRLAALDPLDMAIQVAHLGNVGGLGRPGRDRADSWQDNKKVEPLVCF